MEFTPMVFGNDYKPRTYIILPDEFLGTDESTPFKELTLEEGVLYSLLKNRADLSVKNPKFARNGRAFVIFGQKDLSILMKCGLSKISKMLKCLEEMGLIERVAIHNGKKDLIFVNDWMCRNYSFSPKLKEYLSKEVGTEEG